MRRTTLLPLLTLLLLAGCASSPPKRWIVQTSLSPMTRKQVKASEGLPLQQLEQLILSDDDPAMTRMLIALHAAETDARSAAYLNAGKTAWVAGHPEMAHTLWRAALDCGPRKSQRIQLSDKLVLFTYRPAALFQPKGGKLTDFEPALTGRQTFTPSELEAQFLRELFAVLDLPQANDTLIHKGWVLKICSPEQAQAELDAMRQLAALQSSKLISIQTRLIAAPLENIPQNLRSIFLLREPKQLEDTVVQQLTRWSAAEDGPRLIGAPRLTCFPFQRASVSILQQHAYIQDYALTKQDGFLLTDPEMATAVDGIQLGFRSVRLSQTKVLCQIQPQLILLEHPIPQIMVNLLSKQQLPLQIPQQTSLSGVFHLQLPVGLSHWLPLGVIHEDGARIGHGLLVTLKLIERANGAAK